MGNEKDASYNRLLELFPVSEEELGQLLGRQNAMKSGKTDGYLADWFNAGEEPEHAETLRQIETTLLPPNLAQNFVNHAISSVVVLGQLHDHERREDSDRFLEAIVSCLGRRGPQILFRLIHGYCSDDGAETADAERILICCYQLALASHWLQNTKQFSRGHTENRAPLTSMSRSLRDKNRGDENISLSCWMDWALWTVPHLSTAISSFFHLALFHPSVPFPASAPPFRLPRVNLQTTLWERPTDPAPFALACMSPSFGGDWRRLYSSDHDGCSFLGLQRALLGYKGPTIMLIRTESDEFGFYTRVPWKISRNWFGDDSESFLFRLAPTLAVYSPTGDGKHYMYLNPSNTNRTRSGMNGLAIGGISSECPRLFLSESFERCRAVEHDLTYANGPLLSSEEGGYFDVDAIELWTAVSDQSYAEHSKDGRLYLDVAKALHQRVARVDRAEFVEDFAGGALLNHVYDHRALARGRHSFEIDETHGGYTLKEN